MIYVTMKASEQVRQTIHRFDRFLATYELKILDIIEDTRKGYIELAVNARILGESPLQF